MRKILFVILSICLLTASLATEAQTGAGSNPSPNPISGDVNKKKVKSQYNSNLYEAEESKEEVKSFTAKVRVVRDISEDIEVLFESDEAKGIYSVPRNNKDFAAMLKALEASKLPGGPAVSVTADKDKNIKSVDLQKKP